MRLRHRPRRHGPAPGPSTGSLMGPVRTPVPTPGDGPGPDPGATLLRVAAEALILQDQADEVLDRIRRHHPLGETAPPGGALVRRFFALAHAVGGHYDDAGHERARADLETILGHHARLVSLAMELSAYEWRSERLRQQVESLTGTGMPGRRLEELYAALAARPSAQPAPSPPGPTPPGPTPPG